MNLFRFFLILIINWQGVLPHWECSFLKAENQTGWGESRWIGYAQAGRGNIVSKKGILFSPDYGVPENF